MRLVLIPFVPIVAIFIAAPAHSAVVPLAGAHEAKEPKSPVAETGVDKLAYDEEGRPVTSGPDAPSWPRLSLEENLKVRLRRGYTISFDPREVIAIEQFPLALRDARKSLTAFALGEIAYGSVSAGYTSLMSRIQPLVSFIQPLWALASTSVINPSTGQIASTGQMATVFIGVVGPSVEQNGFLSAIAGDTVLADFLVAPTPVTFAASSSVHLAALQRFSSFVALPSQANDGGDAAASPSLLDASDDAKSDNRVVLDAEINAAVPESSTWVMTLLGFVGLAAVSRKTRRAVCALCV